MKVAWTRVDSDKDNEGSLVLTGWLDIVGEVGQWEDEYDGGFLAGTT